MDCLVDSCIGIFKALQEALEIYDFLDNTEIQKDNSAETKARLIELFDKEAENMKNFLSLKILI